ncbi:MAG: hypothetical protein P8Z30_13435 [Acidobacteriota bacterium]
MTRVRFITCITLTFIAATAAMGFAQGQGKAAAKANNPERKQDIFKNLKFRNIGPTVAGGRVTSVVGIPGNADVYYVGAAAGGVFKTTDGGTTWKDIFKHEATASIGAIALAPSNPNWVWVGTGEANIRNDVIDGHGVYFSPDGGNTWKFMGLADAGQISAILVDPQNPDIVFVAAIGNAWKPNAERGVFRTSDGGKTWKKVLFVDDTTGAADLVMQPGNPKVLFAAMWHVRRYPWTLVNGGMSSGIYRSTDGGDTWKKLTKDLPPGPWGRCALAIAPSNPNHIYALINAKDGMLWGSEDMGKDWKAISDDHVLDVRPFYFSRMVVSPDNENKIFFLSMEMRESTDGGKTTHYADKGVHVDHHAIWIDPKNPNRIIQGNDGGLFLSTNGAKTWRFLNNLPIEQFYQVAVDHSVPFNICGGLQDNGSWCGPSSDLGRDGVNGWEWHSVAGGDGEYAVPAPSDSNILYTDSQNGYILRRNLKTHFSHSIRPYLPNVSEEEPSKLKYRFNWTAPIAVSPVSAQVVYLGANVVFKSTDGGLHWAVISPDLTRNDKSKQVVAGGPVRHDITGAENYDTILSISIAPTDPEVIWVGTDDGLVQVTRNGGKTWTNVTSHIPAAPQWARVEQIGVSPFNAGTAYLTYDAHMLGDPQPYVYKTSDFGQTWMKITEGLPAGAPAHVVREDPNKQGFLVLGTDTGLYYSSDDGSQWHTLKANFPTSPVLDMKFVKKPHDLVVATHGRGVFVLDDVRPLEDITPTIEASSFHLFAAGPGILFHKWSADEGQPTGYLAPNAPDGVVIDYLLKSRIKVTKKEKAARKTPVKIVVTDARGNEVATLYGPSKAGINRFVWPMRYDGHIKLKYEKRPPASPYISSKGPLVPPGVYNVAVTVKGQAQTAKATIAPDPNLHITADQFRSTAKAALTVRNELNALNEMINRIGAMQKQLGDFEQSVEGDKDLQSKYAPVLQRAKALETKLQSLKDSVYTPKVQHNVEEDSVHYLQGFHENLADLASTLAELYPGQAPVSHFASSMSEMRSQLDQHLKVFNDFLKAQVAAYNKDANAAGAPTLLAGNPITVKSPENF